ADFRDRIVHHWLIAKLNPFFEKEFINDSYACRVGKGTHFGIKRVASFIKYASKKYTKDCYILKLDILGYFMHINRNILFEKLQLFIHQFYKFEDKVLVINLCQKIIYNDPTQNCIIKGKKTNWEDLPKNKSLFHSPPNCGLPIGNLTSQVFANFYMNHFDQYLKKELKVALCGRYVDDFVIIHSNKEYLKLLIPQLSNFLLSTLKLTLHPKKQYLQHYTKGVKFLGAIIKPNRIYIANRIKGNFYNAIQKHNNIVQLDKPTKTEMSSFLSSMNSYLGIMKHYKTYKLRRNMIVKNLHYWWWNHVYLSSELTKVAEKKQRRHNRRLAKKQV
ncbi:MAG: hypothetical protein HQ402_01615, partial [Parcubacteria group bacterium]|nr:hypothetical protein [Parcubacteria group bacterium]